MLEKSTPRRRTPLVVGAGILVLAATAVVGVAAAQDPPPPPAPEALTGRAVFPNDVDLKLKLKEHGGATTVVNVEDPSRTAVVRFTLQPGSRFPWHTHFGPVIVNVVSGALTYVEADTCAATTYTAGEAFVDPGHGHVHTAYNPGAGATVLMATFFAAPATGSLLIPADDPGC
jgi:quercetin dioxygenase-like cupin family protein